MDRFSSAAGIRLVLRYGSLQKREDPVFNVEVHQASSALS